MLPRVFIIHGWGGFPDEGWFPWLKNELDKKNISVIVPQMPDTNKPNIEKWVGYLSALVSNPDKNTYFVGHSIGCQAIVRYLASLPLGSNIGGIIFVAGFFDSLTNMDDDEETDKICREWLNTPVDFNKVRKIAGKSMAIFSSDDPYVPIFNSELFKEKLGSEIIIKNGAGHFSGSTGTKKLPFLLDCLLSMIRRVKA